MERCQQRTRCVGVVMAVLVGGLLWTQPAQAQPAVPPASALTFVGGVDVANAYYYRGLPQEDTGIVLQPHGSLAFGLGGPDGRGVVARVGLWGSLHTGSAGLDGPTAQLWYQSIFTAGLEAGVGGGFRVGAAYSANTSPNGLFESISEVSVRVSREGGRGDGLRVQPYVLLAFELAGQADGGRREGKYLEVGASPGTSVKGVRVSAPVRLGVSLGDYYEGFTGDERFGFLSAGGRVERQVGGSGSRLGTWNVHGGVEFLKLGDRNQAYGGTNLIGSVGLGLTY